MIKLKRQVVSYCLFGGKDCRPDEPPSRYWGFSRGVIWALHHLFSDWEAVIYHDYNIEEFGQHLIRYQKAGLVTLVPTERDESIHPALWRFKALWEPDVDYVLSRDMDSQPMVKDRRIVNEFLQSQLAVSAVSDHPSHAYWPMFAGMCGFYVSRFLELTGLKSWRDFIDCGKNSGVNMAVRQADQDILAAIWPRVAMSACEHRISGVPFFGQDNCGLKIRLHELSAGAEGIKDELQRVDDFTLFMGRTGFDQDRLIDFLKAHGDPETVAKLEKAEAE